MHAKHLGLQLSEDDLLDIAVSFDGTWLTRGHTSHIGVGCVVDLLTGMCIDAYVMCTYCHKCETTGKNLQRNKPSEYQEWKAQHSLHCDKNFTGTFIYAFIFFFF